MAVHLNSNMQSPSAMTNNYVGPKERIFKVLFKLVETNADLMKQANEVKRICLKYNRRLEILDKDTLNFVLTASKADNLGAAPKTGGKNDTTSPTSGSSHTPNPSAAGGKGES